MNIELASVNQTTLILFGGGINQVSKNDKEVLRVALANPCVTPTSCCGLPPLPHQTHLTDPSRPESDAGYSFGVRQTFARLYEHHPDIKIFFKMVREGTGC